MHGATVKIVYLSFSKYYSSLTLPFFFIITVAQKFRDHPRLNNQGHPMITMEFLPGLATWFQNTVFYYKNGNQSGKTQDTG